MLIDIMLFLIWMLILIIILATTIYIKVLNKNNRIKLILEKIPNNENPKFLVVIVDATDLELQTALIKIIELFQEHHCYVIFKGPPWRASILEKRLPHNTTIILDEEGELLTKIDINHTPLYVVFNHSSKSPLDIQLL